MSGPTQWQPGGGQQPRSPGEQQPPSTPQPPFMGTMAAPPPKVRPGRVWYLAALALFLGGAAWLVFGILSIKSSVDSFQRVPLPQGGQITLSHSGGYVVYYEAAGAGSGHLPSFNVRVAPASAGAGVQSLKPYRTSLTYNFGSRQGRAVLTLQVSHPGGFRVIPAGAPTVAGGSFLAFGSSIAGGIVRIVIPTVLLMLAGVGGGITIFIIRVVLTSRRRARLSATQMEA